jgi:hypothetical protein
MQIFPEKYQNWDPLIQFQCSPGFIYELKKRNQFFSRRAHLNRRPTVSDDDHVNWIRALLHLLRDVPNHRRIINVDESCWRVHPDGLQTWEPTESQNIQTFCNGDEKYSFTVITAITAARTKLALALIATGKTNIVENNHFSDIGYHLTNHSESGWTTTDIFSAGWPDCKLCTMRAIRFG